MYVFGSDTKARGCFTEFNINTSLGKSASIEAGSGEMQTNESSIVTGISFAEKEKLSVVQCFNDTNHVYAFGHDPLSSMISVTYMAFLINSAGTSISDALPEAISDYQAARLSNLRKHVKVIIGSQILKGYIISMNSKTSDAHHNLQSVTFNMMANEVLR